MKPHKHKVRGVCWRCVLFTLGFPIEHVMWERIAPFAEIARWLGIA